MSKRLFEVGDVVEYRHGGKLEIIFVDHGASDGFPYQCCLAGGDPKKNMWFKHSDLLELTES